MIEPTPVIRCLPTVNAQADIKLVGPQNSDYRVIDQCGVRLNV
jgi:hypothetical protein